MGKLIAIDFGLKRTGIAITDEAKIFAFAHETVPSKDLIEYLKVLLPKEKVEGIILGEPKHLDDTPSEMTHYVHQLKDVLKKAFPTVFIELMDERFTSKMASNALFESGMKKKKRQNKEELDKTSAAIILQSYLQERG